MTASLLQDLVAITADRSPEADALRASGSATSYATLAQRVNAFARGCVEAGLDRQDRVAVYLDKRFETVVASFGAAAAGGVFVPVNPLLKAEQVAYILRDCNVRLLVTSAERLLPRRDPRRLPRPARRNRRGHRRGAAGAARRRADEVAGRGVECARRAPHRVIDTDMAAILYTSGSTGKPKGVVLSHRNMVAGAKSVAQYLENRPADRILSALPLSFDAGFSQLTTAFHAGASVVLINYLLPRDVIRTVRAERITGLTAVPPLWIQLAQLDWPARTPRAICATSPTPAARCRARRSTHCVAPCRKRSRSSCTG